MNQFNRPRKKLKCRQHPDNKDFDDYYFWVTDVSGRDIYHCKKCQDQLNRDLDRESRIKENNDRQAEESWERYKKRHTKRTEAREKSIKEDIWDFVVKRELCKGLKLKGAQRSLYSESIPKEVLQLKRAQMKLQRLIDKVKKNNRDQREIKIEKIIHPLVNCKKHGLLNPKDVIKGGKSRWTGEQRYKCRECMSDQHKNYYERRKDYVLQKHAEYRKQYPEKVRETKAKSRRKCNVKNNQHERTA